jgi:hypothetical protein
MASYYLHAGYADREIAELGDHVVNAYSSFFGLQPVSFPVNGSAQLLTVLAMLMGFVHLGIFIAHLYTLITRR